MCTRFNFAMRPKHLLCTEHSIDGGKWSANIWRLWGGENSEWQRPETAASVTSVSREMGRPRAFYQLTARSPAWRRHVTLVTCHVSILILQTLSTRLGNYWSFPFPLVWLLGYLVTCYNSPFALISSLSHFAHLLHTTSNTCIHTELSFMGDNANEMLHICHSFVSLQNVAWWGFMLPVVSNISFFGARHRPGRFSSRVSNFDIELYINIHKI